MPPPFFWQDIARQMRRQSHVTCRCCKCCRCCRCNLSKKKPDPRGCGGSSAFVARSCKRSCTHRCTSTNTPTHGSLWQVFLISRCFSLLRILIKNAFTWNSNVPHRCSSAYVGALLAFGWRLFFHAFSPPFSLSVSVCVCGNFYIEIYRAKNITKKI